MANPDEVALRIAGTDAAVREALVGLFARPVLVGLPDEARSTAELVLAEALNNIVEHAYSSSDGDIDLRVLRQEHGLYCHIRDSGKGMPQGVLPEGSAPEIGAFDDLPEGGYGWFLIRSLTEQLEYRREAGSNHLSFQINLEQ